MPAARGVKRTASKSSTATTSAASKNKKKRGAVQLEIPVAPKRKGRVLVCGQGDVGQLGLGEDVAETNKFKFVTALPSNIVDVCAGGMHSVALDSNGKVWTFGCNDEGALGRATNGDKDEGTPKTVTLPSPAVAISAGDSHTAALLKNGDVYAWGAFRDSHGSMGLVVRGREGKACRAPARLSLPEQVVAIASGGDHLVLLTVSGSVYTMGCGEQGQLGRLSQRSASRDARQGFSALLTPGKVSLKNAVSRIWAGHHATAALPAAGPPLAWGLNNYLQLGISGEKRKCALYSPTECDLLPPRAWRHLAAGQHHTLAVDDEGKLYCLGRCEYGRLGLGDGVGDAESLTAVPALSEKKCVAVAAGTANSFAVTDTGEVLAWGMGSEGQLGTGSSTDATVPTPAVLPPHESRPVAIAAGGQHAILLAEDLSAKTEDTTASEEETVEEKTEDEDVKEEDEEEEEQEPEKKKARGTKRQKKQEQDQEDEVSSTSSVPPAAKPQQVNGDEKPETTMEVDEIDSAVEKKEEPDTEKITEQKEIEAESKTDDIVPEKEKMDVDKEELSKEITDTSSQGTVDSDVKSQEIDI